MIELSIIIVNYKTALLTGECIQSLYDTVSNVKYEVIVVDNHSQDSSKDVLTAKFPEIKWIQNEYNAGFGRANNLAVKEACGQFVLLLNSDVELLPNSHLEQCIKLMQAEPSIGVLGCKQLNQDGSEQKSTYYDVATIRYLLTFNILWFKLFKPKPKSLDAVMGAFMLFKKDDFMQIGGFDPDFFMYAEELELCNRFKTQGKRIMKFNQFAAIHKNKGSSPNSNWALNQNLLSNALLFLKMRGWAGYFTYHLIFHLNVITNLLLWPWISKSERRSFSQLYKSYFHSWSRYLTIPFYYTFASNRKFLKVK